MVKIYQRYVLTSTFGVIVSPHSNILFDPSGKYAICGALESILIWGIRGGIIHATLCEGQSSPEEQKKLPIVCRLALSPDLQHLAAGYVDGSIRVWNLQDKTVKHVFRGHKSEVTCLAFNKNGTLLASGSKDTDIVVWDIVNDSGLFRLRGHKNVVTDLKFLNSSNCLLSSSKDTFIKLWDLQTQHCVQTIVGHRGEVWSFDVNNSETRLVTCSSDNLIRVFVIGDNDKELHEKLISKRKAQSHLSSNTTPSKDLKNSQIVTEQLQNLQTERDEDGSDITRMISEGEERIVFFGTLERKSRERGVLIRYNTDNTLLACQSAGKSLEMWKVNSELRIKSKMKKRKRRQKQKQNSLDVESTKPNNETDSSSTEFLRDVSDEFSPKEPLRTAHKIHSFAFPPHSSSSPSSSKDPTSTLEILIALSNNTLELYQKKENIFEKKSSIDHSGHRSDIRAVALSSTDEMLLSMSNGLMKVWNVKTRNCIRTMKCGYALCGFFVPGDRHVVLGTKTGKIETYDLQSARCLDVIDAHSAAIWSLVLRPDKTGFISASADKTVKFWNFDLVPDETNPTAKRLSVSLEKTIEMSDDVLCARFSKDGKYFAVSLLDSTVKIYFADTMKFCFSLYGHKLPVLSFDISDDSALVVTASADKNIKIWGLDFGDCHKSLFAHDDSIMQVQFVPRTHYFFSVSKDGYLKYWDADHYEHVLSLPGHQSEIWAMCVSSQGDFVVTGSHDRSIRIWERTTQQLVVDSEKEQQLEEIWDATLEEEDRYKKEDSSAVSRPTIQTLETIKAGEKIMEAIEVADRELQILKDYQHEFQEAEKRRSESQKNDQNHEKTPLVPPPVPNPILQGRTPSDHVLYVLTTIRPSELEEGLLILPFHQVLKLIKYIDEWIQQGKSIELASMCLFFLLKIHSVQLSTDRTVLQTLLSLRENVRRNLQNLKNIIGFNKAAMTWMKRAIEEETNTEFFDATAKLQQIRTKQRESKTKHLNYWEQDI